MPTFNQLVRKGREQVTYKSTSPALQHGLCIRDSFRSTPW